MVYRGETKEGKVTGDGLKAPPDGSRFSVRVVRGAARSPQRGPRRLPTVYERLKASCGIIDDLPPDASRNIDHYLYGTPKRT